jgi:hypothetical protein
MGVKGVNIEPYRITQDDGETRTIGYIIDGLTFVTTRVETKHLFRGGRGLSVKTAKARGTACWGIDADALQDLLYRNIRNFKVIAGSTVYVALLDDFLSSGKRSHFPPHKPQFFLNLKRFEIGGLSDEDREILEMMKSN